MLSAENSGEAGGIDTCSEVLELSFDYSRATFHEDEARVFRGISGVKLYGVGKGQVILRIGFDSALRPVFLVFPNDVTWASTNFSGLGGAAVKWNTFFENNRDRAARTKSRVEYCTEGEICLVIEAFGSDDFHEGDDITSSVFARLWFEPKKRR